jgi:uncharacterized protein YegP (UPF0339 family)
VGRFIVMREGEAYRFVLLSDKGRALASSAPYAHMDACKKGICALAIHAPAAPLTDATAGERAGNPKIELTARDGAFYYAVKARNGKEVLHSVPHKTRKACLRAVAMLRTGVQGAGVYLRTEAGDLPLTVGRLPL